MGPTDRTKRPVQLRRCWIFVGGADEDQLIAAGRCGADVMIHELEDFTDPAERPRARQAAPSVLSAWKRMGAVAAVRVNPLAEDGMADLEAAMAGAPDVIMLPKVTAPEHVTELDKEVARLELEYGLTAGATELVPNVESARGLMRTFDICRASPRVTAALVASEDMAMDLGAVRGPDGTELAYVRSRFHVECTAAGAVSIDCPYTWTDKSGVAEETRHARRLGYTAKSAVHLAHAAIINEVLTPRPDEVVRARQVVEAFEAREGGDARVEVDGSLVELPIYLNAKRLIDRAEKLDGTG